MWPMNTPTLQPIATSPKTDIPAVAHRRPGINWRFEFGQYGYATLIAAVLFGIASLYLYARSGNYTLNIANRALADAALLLLVLVLLLGPLTRWYNTFDRYLQYRKELGLTAAALVVAHFVISFFLVTSASGRVRFVTTGAKGFIFGSLATLVLIGLAAISSTTLMRAIGSKRWWSLQRWGIRIAYVTTLLHVWFVALPRWQTWYTKGDARVLHDQWPSFGILTGWLAIAVLVLRALEHANDKLARMWWRAMLVLVPLAWVITLWIGRKFA